MSHHRVDDSNVAFRKEHTYSLAIARNQNIMPPAPSLAQVQALHKSLLTASQRFATYNFNEYFVRRTNETFKPVLESLSSKSLSTSQDTASLTKFVEEQKIELEVLKRAGEINRMFEGPKLVVEHARPITGGGGAGAEASAGGGGQPVNPGAGN
jgi:hypothetical protein